MLIKEIYKDIEQKKEYGENYVCTGKKPDQTVVELYQMIFDYLFSCAKETMNNRKNYATETKEQIEERIKKQIMNQLLIAGGSLSDEVNNHYNGKSKDIDVFIELDLLFDIFRGFWTKEPSNSDKRYLEILEGLQLNLKEFNFRNNHTFENECTDIENYRYMAAEKNIDSILVGNFRGKRVEIVIMSNILKSFDLEFRKFYYNGHYIFGTEQALENIKNKQITISSIYTPYSTFVRVKEFSKRYGFEVEELTYFFLKVFLHKLSGGDGKVLKETFLLVNKYTTEEKIDEYIKEILSVDYDELDENLVNSYIRSSDECQMNINKHLPILKALYKNKKKLKLKYTIKDFILDYKDDELYGILTEEQEDELYNKVKSAYTIKNEMNQLKNIFNGTDNCLRSEEYFDEIMEEFNERNNTNVFHLYADFKRYFNKKIVNKLKGMDPVLGLKQFESRRFEYDFALPSLGDKDVHNEYHCISAEEVNLKIDFYSLIFYFTEFNSLKFDVEYPVTLNHKEDYYIYTKPTIDKCKNSKVNYSIGSFIGFPEAYLFFEGPRVEQVKKTCFEILEDIDVEKFRKKIGTKGKPITKFLNEQKTIKANGNQKYSKKVSEINSKHMFTAGIRYFK